MGNPLLSEAMCMAHMFLGYCFKGVSKQTLKLTCFIVLHYENTPIQID